MIAIIDYGMGNLRSVEKALEKVGSEVRVTSDSTLVQKAESLILPGVGAFKDCMKGLKDLGLIEAILEGVREGKPFLGICLGLQVLFTESEEDGLHLGLDLIKGRVRRLPSKVKVPHMGWNQINKKKEAPILEGIPNNSNVYFVHSYYVDPEDKKVVLTETDYGVTFTSGVQKDNIQAFQFHPEKSGDLGLHILKNFLKIAEN